MEKKSRPLVMSAKERFKLRKDIAQLQGRTISWDRYAEDEYRERMKPSKRVQFRKHLVELQTRNQ
jgi:hypothetical protein